MTTTGSKATSEDKRLANGDLAELQNGEALVADKSLPEKEQLPKNEPPKEAASQTAGAESDKDLPKDEKDKKKHPLTWERTIEIAKLLATIWVAFVGSYVTMQFNERQHELNRIEAIAKMLPHISSKDSVSDDDDSAASPPGASALTVPVKVPANKPKNSSKLSTTAPSAPTPAAQSQPSPISGDHDMSRDGAIWAIFRTANNRVMLRDLAALFPQDIYRVVGSIAIAGELENDQDALVALQVASEKLAAQYSVDPRHAELASRLYAQALRLKERKPDDTSPLHVIDLSADVIEAPTSDEHIARLVRSVNDLADLHMREDSSTKKGTAGHWQAKDLYKRARLIGTGSKDVQVQLQVVRADLGLATVYLIEHVLGDALGFLREAHALEHQIAPKPDTKDPLKALDSDGDGFATEQEISTALEDAKAELIELERANQPKGVPLR